MESWSEKGRHPELIEVLSKGNTLSKIYAINLLTPHNYMNVKNALLDTLDDENRDVCLAAAGAIEQMGANPDEQEKIKSVRAKWGTEKNGVDTDASDSETTDESQVSFTSKRKKPFVIKESPLKKLKSDK